MAEITVNASALGTALSQLLGCDEIQPGSDASYELCKIIYTYHPLGAKLVDKPVEIAQSEEREIAVPNGPEERVVEAFKAEEHRLKVREHRANIMRLARIYGIASVAVLVEGEALDQPLDPAKLWNKKISFNAFDPLNTAGSLVLNQNPNAMDFQHVTDIRVAGKTYHRSRTCVIMNEAPLYIQYTASAFGFVGRSVYQRSLFPLKSFIQSMITDDLVTLKAGVLIAKIKQQGSIIDQAMSAIQGLKRAFVKEAKNGNVISIAPEEAIETLNLQNLDGAFGAARHDILENIAAAAGMPAKMLTQETFAEGFGEGTEDAKDLARYIDGVRTDMQPLVDYFDRIVQYRAWNPDFYAAIQRDFPERYKGVSYKAAFYEWVNSFKAQWPSLLKEPESEAIKVDDVRLKAVIALVEVLLPALDPENKARVIEWACDNFNALKLLFDAPLTLDLDALASYEAPADTMDPLREPHEPRPFAAQDAMRALAEATARLPDRRRAKELVALAEGHRRRA